MSYFVHNKDGGFVNLDRVATLVPGCLDKSLFYDCFNDRDEKLGRIDGREDFFGRTGMIPDTTGTMVVEFGLEDDGEVWTLCSPVLGWVVYDKVAEPITAETLDDGWCLVHRDGRCVFPEDRWFETIDKAKGYAADKIRKERERRQQIKEEQSSPPLPRPPANTALKKGVG